MTSATEIETPNESEASGNDDGQSSVGDVNSGDALTRRDLRRDRRRRWWGDLGLEILVALIGVGAIAAGFLGFGLNEPSIHRSSENGITRSGPKTEAASESVFTLSVIDSPQGVPSSVALLVPELDSSGGDVIFVPLGTMAEVASFGLRPLREVPELGDDSLLEETVANMLGIKTDRIENVTASELTEMMRPLGPLSVDLPTSVALPRETSRPRDQGSTRSIGPGLTQVQPEDLPNLFAGMKSESELDRIVRHQAIWEAILKAAAKTALPQDGPGAAMSKALNSLAAGETAFHILPVESISGGTDGSDELFKLRRDEARELLTRLGGPNATSHITVQLLNGTGTPGLAQSVVPLLTGIGAQVSLTGNAARFDHATTIVAYADPKDRSSAEAVRQALGVGDVVRSRSGIMLVDVMVVMGKDLKDRVPKGEVQD